MKTHRNPLNSLTGRISSSLAFAASILLHVASTAHAASIQFDLGNDSLPYTGTQAPAHNVGALGVSDNTWNSLSGDASTGLFYTDGSAASGLSVDFGEATGSGNVINWSSSVGISTNPLTDSSFHDTALMEDSLFSDGRKGGPDVFAVRVQGLAPGEYTVFSINEEHIASTRTYDVGIGVDTDNTTAIGDLTISTIGSGFPAAWVAGTNYVSQNVTVNASTDWVAIIVDDTTDVFGQLNGFQIVAIPEPSSTALIGLAGLGLLLRRRR